MNMEEFVELKQDTGELKIKFKREDIHLLEQDIKTITGWRTPTIRYRSIYHRFLSQGSSKYNCLIEQLNKRGW